MAKPIKEPVFLSGPSGGDLVPAGGGSGGVEAESLSLTWVLIGLGIGALAVYFYIRSQENE